MPGILYQPRDRRTFLKSAGLAALATLSTIRTKAQSDTQREELHLALLSDTHIPGDRINGHRGFNPWENLKRIVPEVQEAKADGVLICGDAARLEGLTQDYTELKDLLQPLSEAAPIYIGLGNHDDRVNFRKAFPNPAGAQAKINDKHVLAIDSPGTRVILLDSLMYVNKVAGLLGKAQRNWLVNYLAANRDKPTVLFVHHTLTDEDGDLLDAERLFSILEPHSHVKAVFFGHSHVWNISQRNRLRLINLPAVGYNFRDQDPVGWVDARFHAKGADLTLRAFAGNRGEDGKVFAVSWL